MSAAIAFGKIIRQLRLDAELTQEQLGLEADLRRTYISILELGQQQPSLTTILKLAKALKISAADIVSLVEKELSKKSRKKRK